MGDTLTGRWRIYAARRRPSCAATTTSAAIRRDALLLLYADFTCPRCALAHERLVQAGAHVAFRHFALQAKHPRAVPVACAAEAAAAQGAFWPFVDALYADQGRLDDPHLWQRARELGLDVARFDEDRRGDRAGRPRARGHARRARRRSDDDAGGFLWTRRRISGFQIGDWLARLGYDGAVRIPKPR